MSFCFVAPFPAGVAFDAVRVVPPLCEAAVGAAPLDPAGAGVLMEVITHRWATGTSAGRMLRVPPTTGPRPAADRRAHPRTKDRQRGVSPLMDSVEDQDHRGSRPSPSVRAPRGVSGRRSGGTATASIRMLTARAMLRHGRDPSTVAEATHVPWALVELMRDSDPNLSPRHRRAG
jgi:hypothetical protein